MYIDGKVQFPGYTFVRGKSSYRGEDPGEGGYVYSQPGMYSNVALLDVASMHPTSIEDMNLFGPYTDRFSRIKQTRVAIKHHDLDKAKALLGDAMKNLDLKTDDDFKGLAFALKIAINSVYGLTSAKFQNKFRDPRNIDNIVAKRGALYMMDLKAECQKRGWTVVHCKTDSIKLADYTQEMVDFVMQFSKDHGYDIELECVYEKMCIVNNAVYISKIKEGDDGMRPSKNSPWSATGAQFAQPYVFKTLFSHEPVRFEDMCETKSVGTALYLDMNENLDPEQHDYQFVGKTGQFSPIKPGCGGGELMRIGADKIRTPKPEFTNLPNPYTGKGHIPQIAKQKNFEGDQPMDESWYIPEWKDQYSAPSGTKGFRWLESETVKELGKEDTVDRSYYDKLVDDAVADISQYGDFEWFTE